jgi:hypothetical protein
MDSDGIYNVSTKLLNQKIRLKFELGIWSNEVRYSSFIVRAVLPCLFACLRQADGQPCIHMKPILVIVRVQTHKGAVSITLPT